MDKGMDDKENRGGVGGRFGLPNWAALKNFHVRVQQLISLPEFIAFAVGHATTRPTCDSSRRDGEINTRGGAGVHDVKYICQKDTSDAYAWRGQVTTPSGTGVANRVAYWTGAETLGSDAGLTYNPSTDALTTTGLITSSSATAGIGYATGAGGTVTQATDKTTGVTLNKICGQITLASDSMNANAERTFTVTNSAVAATDIVIVNHVSGGTSGAYLVSIAAVAAGSFAIVISNQSTGALNEQPVLGFAVIKGVSA